MPIRQDTASDWPSTEQYDHFLLTKITSGTVLWNASLIKIIESTMVILCIISIGNWVSVALNC